MYKYVFGYPFKVYGHWTTKSVSCRCVAVQEPLPYVFEEILNLIFWLEIL
jgi:hypothetical protein